MREGGGRSRGVGLSFHQPSPPPRSIPSIPVRFEFRVEILSARFASRAREKKERKGKWRSRAQLPLSRPVPPGRFNYSNLRTSGASWKRRNDITILFNIFSREKSALLRFRDHFFFPARSFVVEGVNFFRGWTRLAAARGDLLRRYRGVSVVEAMAGDRFRPPSPPPSTPSWRGNTSTESTDDGLQTRRE